MLELLFELYAEATKTCNYEVCKVSDIHGCRCCRHYVQGIWVPIVMEAVWRVPYHHINK